MKTLKNNSEEHFETLVLWLQKKGFEVFLYTDAPNCVFWNLSEVHINSRMHAEKRLHVLIHECGHVLINRNRERPFRLSKHARVSHYSKISRDKRVSVLSEEMEAWRRGENLARRLSIDFDVEKFDKLKTTCLMGYIHWAADQDF